MAVKPIKVSQLNGYINKILGTDPVLSQVTVLGQISNFKHHGSGHCYFSLKDETAKVNCFLPAGILNTLRFEPADELEVVCSGYITVYSKGGYYSLNIRDMSLNGQGGLALAFEQMKEKLRLLGYFDLERKRAIPAWTDNVAIITSNTGAAIEDMLRIVREKNNLTNIYIFPSLVQGDGAAKELAAGLSFINSAYPFIDVIILGRGGGSIEDLWAFNEQVLANAIYNSQIPVISAVGHESDWTIADYVADKRASTPTAAADIAVCNIELVSQKLQILEYNIRDSISNIMQNKAQRLKAFGMSNLINTLKQRVSIGEQRAGFYLTDINRATYARISQAEARLAGQNADMNRAIYARVSDMQAKLSGLKMKLDALSPQSVLDRGYSILINRTGCVISNVSQLGSGDVVTARLSDGNATLIVDDIEANDG